MSFHFIVEQQYYISNRLALREAPATAAFKLSLSNRFKKWGIGHGTNDIVFVRDHVVFHRQFDRRRSMPRYVFRIRLLIILSLWFLFAIVDSKHGVKGYPKSHGVEFP